MSERPTPYDVTYADAAAFERAIRREVDRLNESVSGPYRPPEGGLIRALMTQRGWAQIDVAAMLRVDTSTVRRWCAAPGRYGSGIPFAAWWLLLLRAGAVSPDRLDGAASSSRGPSTPARSPACR